MRTRCSRLTYWCVRDLLSRRPSTTILRCRKMTTRASMYTGLHHRTLPLETATVLWRPPRGERSALRLRPVRLRRTMKRRAMTSMFGCELPHAATAEPMPSRCAAWLSSLAKTPCLLRQLRRSEAASLLLRLIETSRFTSVSWSHDESETVCTGFRWTSQSISLAIRANSTDDQLKWSNTDVQHNTVQLQ